MLHERCTRARVRGIVGTLVDPFAFAFPHSAAQPGAPARGDRGTRTVYIIRVARVRVGESRRCVYILWTTVHTSTTPQSLVCVDFRRGMWKTSRAGSRYTCRFPSAGPARIRDPSSVPAGGAFFHLCLDFPCCTSHKAYCGLWAGGRATLGWAHYFKVLRSAVHGLRKNDKHTVYSRAAGGSASPT